MGKEESEEVDGRSEGDKRDDAGETELCDFATDRSDDPLVATDVNLLPGNRVENADGCADSERVEDDGPDDSARWRIDSACTIPDDGISDGKFPSESEIKVFENTTGETEDSRVDDDVTPQPVIEETRDDSSEKDLGCSDVSTAVPNEPVEKISKDVSKPVDTSPCQRVSDDFKDDRLSEAQDSNTSTVIDNGSSEGNAGITDSKDSDPTSSQESSKEKALCDVKSDCIANEETSTREDAGEVLISESSSENKSDDGRIDSCDGLEEKCRIDVEPSSTSLCESTMSCQDDGRKAKCSSDVVDLTKDGDKSVDLTEVEAPEESVGVDQSTAEAANDRRDSPAVIDEPERCSTPSKIDPKAISTLRGLKDSLEIIETAISKGSHFVIPQDMDNPSDSPMKISQECAEDISPIGSNPEVVKMFDIIPSNLEFDEAIDDAVNTVNTSDEESLLNTSLSKDLLLDSNSIDSAENQKTFKAVPMISDGPNSDDTDTAKEILSETDSSNLLPTSSTADEDGRSRAAKENATDVSFEINHPKITVSAVDSPFNDFTDDSSSITDIPDCNNPATVSSVSTDEAALNTNCSDEKKEVDKTSDEVDKPTALIADETLSRTETSLCNKTPSVSIKDGTDTSMMKSSNDEFISADAEQPSISNLPVEQIDDVVDMTQDNGDSSKNIVSIVNDGDTPNFTETCKDNETCKNASGAPDLAGSSLQDSNKSSRGEKCGELSTLQDKSDVKESVLSNGPDSGKVVDGSPEEVDEGEDASSKSRPKSEAAVIVEKSDCVTNEKGESESGDLEMTIKVEETSLDSVRPSKYLLRKRNPQSIICRTVPTVLPPKANPYKKQSKYKSTKIESIAKKLVITNSSKLNAGTDLLCVESPRKSGKVMKKPSKTEALLAMALGRKISHNIASAVEIVKVDAPKVRQKPDLTPSVSLIPTEMVHSSHNSGGSVIDLTKSDSATFKNPGRPTLPRLPGSTIICQRPPGMPFVGAPRQLVPPQDYVLQKFGPLNVPGCYPPPPMIPQVIPRPRSRLEWSSQHKYVEAFYRTKSGSIKKKLVKVVSNNADPNLSGPPLNSLNPTVAPPLTVSNVEATYSECVETSSPIPDSIHKKSVDTKKFFEMRSKEVEVPEKVLKRLYENAKTDTKTDDKVDSANSTTSRLLNLPKGGAPNGSEEVVFHSSDLKVILVQPESDLHSSKKTTLIPMCNSKDGDGEEAPGKILRRKLRPSLESVCEQLNKKCDESFDSTRDIPQPVEPSKSPDIVLLPKSVAQQTKIPDSEVSEKSLQILKVPQFGSNDERELINQVSDRFIPLVSIAASEPKTSEEIADEPSAVEDASDNAKGGKGGMVARKATRKQRRCDDAVRTTRSRLSKEATIVLSDEDDDSGNKIVVSDVSKGCGGRVTIAEVRPEDKDIDLTRRDADCEQRDAIHRLRRLGTDVSYEDHKVGKSVTAGDTVLVTPVEDAEIRPPAIKLLEDMAKSTELPVSSPVLTALQSVRPKRKCQSGKAPQEITKPAEAPSLVQIESDTSVQPPDMLPDDKVKSALDENVQIPCPVVVEKEDKSLLENGGSVVDTEEQLKVPKDERTDESETKCSGGVFLIRPQHYVKTVDGEQVWCCDICTVVCSQLQLFRKHYLKLHISPKFISEKDKEMWNIVDSTDDDNNLFKCHVCKIRYNCKSDLKTHLSFHPEKTQDTSVKSPNQYVCPKCDAVFKWRKPFGKHKKVCVEGDKSTGKPSHHCLYCNETFYTPYRKKNHILSNHPYTRRKHPCIFCSKIFASNIILFNHLVNQHSTVFFGCTSCKERFLNSQELKQHFKKTHPSENHKIKCVSPPKDKEYFECSKCDRIFLIETSLNKHECMKPEKDFGVRQKRSKPVLIERRIEGRKRIDGETEFFSKVSNNVRDNLAYHLDGKLHPVDPPDKVQSEHRTILNFNAGVPSTSVAAKPNDKPTSKSPNTPTYEKFTFSKEYDGRCGLTSFIKDASYLDISTQLIMRRNLQRLNLLPENNADPQWDVPAVLALERLGAQCAESFGTSTPPPPDEETNCGDVEGKSVSDSTGPGCEWSGEWVRERTYVCSTCLWQSPCLWTMEDHKYTDHPHVWTPQHELNTPNHKIIADFVYQRLIETPKEERRERPNRRERFECTKCGVNDIRTKPDLHRHIVECAGEDLTALEALHNAVVVRPPATKRRSKWRGGSRRARQGLKRNIPSTPPAQQAKRNRKLLRTKPGDADTIEKMIANLPAKRVTRKVLGFDEVDIKTRSQATIQNSTSLVSIGQIKKSPKIGDKVSPPKKMERKTQGIDTSAENGNVLSSLRMMPVKKNDDAADSTPPRLEVEEAATIGSNTNKEIPVLTPVMITPEKSDDSNFIKYEGIPPAPALLLFVPPVQNQLLIQPLPESKPDAPIDPICGVSIVQGKIKYETLSSIEEETARLAKKGSTSKKIASKTLLNQSKSTKKKPPLKKITKAGMKKKKKPSAKKSGKKLKSWLLKELQAQNAKKKGGKKNLKKKKKADLRNKKKKEPEVRIEGEKEIDVEMNEEPNVSPIVDGKKKRKSDSPKVKSESEKKKKVLKEEKTKIQVEKRKKTKDEDKKRKEEEDRIKADEEAKRKEEELKKENDKKKKEEEKKRKEEERKKKEEEVLKKKEEDAKRKEEEKRKKEEELKKKKEEEARKKEEKLEETRKKKEEEKKKREEEAKKKREEAARKKEEEKKRKEEEARLKKEEEARKEEERLRKEEEEKRRKEAEAKKRRDEAAKKREEEKKRKEEEAKKEEERLKREEEEKRKKEEEAKKRREEAARKREEERNRLEEERLKKEEEEERLRVAEERRLKEEKEREDARLKKLEEERLTKEEEETKRKEALEEKQRKELEEKRRRVEEDRRRKEDEEERLDQVTRQQQLLTHADLGENSPVQSSCGSLSPGVVEADDSKLSDTDSVKSLKGKLQKKKGQRKDMLMKLNRMSLQQKIRRNKMKRMKEPAPATDKEVVSSGMKWSVEVSEDSSAKSTVKDAKDVKAENLSSVDLRNDPVDWLSDHVPPSAPLVRPVPLTGAASVTDTAGLVTSTTPNNAPYQEWKDNPVTTTNLGSILDSVNNLLNEPDIYGGGFMNSSMPAQYSLADLQRAMGASDAEMAVLQHLGEIKVDEHRDEDWSELNIMDLDKQHGGGDRFLGGGSTLNASPIFPDQQFGGGALNQWDVGGRPSGSSLVQQPIPPSQYVTSNLNMINSRCVGDKRPSCVNQSNHPKDASSALLAAHPGKEVVCPTCACHFIGFPALQLHLSKHHPTKDNTQINNIDAKGIGGVRRSSTQDLSMLNRRALLESAKGCRLVCYICQQILPFNLMSSHLVVEHYAKPGEISKCQAIADPISNEKQDKGEKLKNKMSSALGDLLDRAVNNLLTAKQEGNNRMSGSAMELLDKLSALRKRESSIQQKSQIKGSLIKVFAKNKLEAALRKGIPKGIKPGNYTCGLCGETFLWESTWKKHVFEMHTRVNGNQNTDCNLSDPDDPEEEDWRAESGDESEVMSDLKPAKETITPHVNLICSDCGLGFESMSELLGHRAELHRKGVRRGSTCSQTSGFNAGAAGSTRNSSAATSRCSTPASVAPVTAPANTVPPPPPAANVSIPCSDNVGSVPPPSISPAPNDTPPTIAPEPPTTRRTRSSAGYVSPPTPPPPVLTPEGDVKTTEEKKPVVSSKESLIKPVKEIVPLRRGRSGSKHDFVSSTDVTTGRRGSLRSESGDSNGSRRGSTKSDSSDSNLVSSTTVGAAKSKEALPSTEVKSKKSKTDEIKSQTETKASPTESKTGSSSAVAPKKKVKSTMTNRSKPSVQTPPPDKNKKRSRGGKSAESRPKRMRGTEDESVKKRAEIALRELNLATKLKNTSSSSNTSVRWASAMTFSPKPKSTDHPIGEITPERAPKTSAPTTVYDFVEDAQM